MRRVKWRWLALSIAASAMPAAAQIAVSANDGKQRVADLPNIAFSDPKQLETYRFDGKTLILDTAGAVPLDARPGAIATARSR